MTLPWWNWHGTALPDMKGAVSITIPSHPKYLSVVRALTSRMAELADMPGPEVDKIRLAVDEACSNVIKYAYKGDTGRKIVVKFRVIRTGFEVVIEDTGEKTDPSFIAGRDLDDVRPGGLGIHLIKRAFDVFGFDEKKKKGNRLRLIRYKRGNNEN